MSCIRKRIEAADIPSLSRGVIVILHRKSLVCSASWYIDTVVYPSVSVSVSVQ